ncbi:MAG TPA: hypothetical protein VF771_16580 [Longimicrobiaceae bacterium]
MSRTVKLSDDVYQRLETEAAAAGTTPAEWIAARLPEPCANGDVAATGESTVAPESSAPLGAMENGSSGKTLADRLAGRIGRFSSGRSDLSERVGEIFQEGMLEKKRKGHL